MDKRMFIVHYDLIEERRLNSWVIIIAENVVEAKHDAKLAICSKHGSNVKFKIKNVSLYNTQ